MTKSRSGVDWGREEHEGQKIKIAKKLCGSMDVFTIFILVIVSRVIHVPKIIKLYKYIFILVTM